MLLVTTSAVASWRVIPIRIDLDARNKTGSVKVINEGDTPISFQLSASRWTQDEEAKDLYENTEELVFFPRILTVPAGEERMVRAGFKVPATDREKAYRLFIEQIPEKTPDSAAQVSILIRFGVPVFSAPLKPQPKWDIKDLRIKGESLTFDLINTGNVNLQLHSAAVTGFDKAGNELFANSIQGWYLLSGQHRLHTLPLPPDVCSKARKLELALKADKLELTRVIELGPEQCGQ